jgi:glyoxylase-like metal-dependent hydrolase (beta-lactamase superfamily II)
MDQKIITIGLQMPFNFGSTNCYLLHSDDGYYLIDTGFSNKRSELEAAMQKAGCEPGDLRLIILTHGDFDHTANAAYLRLKYATKIAMHRNDAEMVTSGNMFCNRDSANFLLKNIPPFLLGFGKSKQFIPDLYLEDEDDLTEYGLNARILHIPGHTKGSIGILTDQRDLFCGDLLENTKIPSRNSLVDIPEVLDKSVDKLKALSINTVYPGHGPPFSMAEFVKNER